jgi:arginine-tRNA-protein transferase
VTTQARDAPQFYLTAPTPCPYLPDRVERKVFTHLIGRRAPELNNALSQSGFRRSQTIAYRPACDGCKACVSIRVPVDEVRLSRTMRKVLAHNADLVGHWKDNVPTNEQYSLFRYYLDSRHADGGMSDMNVLDYAMMIEDSHVDTHLVEYRKRGPDSGLSGTGTGDLLALALTDVLEDGLSMVYSFYDVDQTSRSLGTLMILDHFIRARKMGLPYVYLGYWVDGSPKMAYKGRFRPQEHLSMDGWTRVD